MKIKIYFNRHNDRPCAILLEETEILVDKLDIHIELTSKYTNNKKKQPVFWLEGICDAIILQQKDNKVYAKIS